MRIALLQTPIQPRVRSANLSRVLRRIVGAAEAVPAPDILLLPGCCDGGCRDGLTRGMAQGFSESLAAAAREWGVYLAAGLMRFEADDPWDCARLFDPDGDVIAQSSDPALCEVVSTPLGRLGIGLHGAGTLPRPPEAACDVLLVPGRWTAPPGHLERAGRQLATRLAELARLTGATVCATGAVTDTAADDQGALWMGGTAAYAPDGRQLAATAGVAEETVVAQIAPSASGRAQSSE